MIYLALVSLIWAFSFGLIGSALSGVDAFLVSTLRLGCASLIFLPFLRLRKIGRSDTQVLFFCGFVQFGLMYACYMHAFHFLPSHLVAIFSILTPLYVVFIHDLRERSFSKKYLFAGLLSVLGAAIIKAKELPSGDFWTGFALMQCAGISFAYGQVRYRDWKIRNKRIQDREVFAILAFGGCACAGATTFFLGERDAFEINVSECQSILYLGCVASGLGFFLWNKGASMTNAGTLAAFNNAVVPLAVLCSLFVFGEIEEIERSQLIRLLFGGATIVLSVWLTSSPKVSLK